MASPIDDLREMLSTAVIQGGGALRSFLGIAVRTRVVALIPRLLDQLELLLSVLQVGLPSKPVGTFGRAESDDLQRYQGAMHPDASSISLLLETVGLLLRIGYGEWIQAREGDSVEIEIHGVGKDEKARLSQFLRELIPRLRELPVPAGSLYSSGFEECRAQWIQVAARLLCTASAFTDDFEALAPPCADESNYLSICGALGTISTELPDILALMSQRVEAQYAALDPKPDDESVAGIGWTALLEWFRDVDD